MIGLARRQRARRASPAGSCRTRATRTSSSSIRRATPRGRGATTRCSRRRPPRSPSRAAERARRSAPATCRRTGPTPSPTSRRTSRTGGISGSHAVGDPGRVRERPVARDAFDAADPDRHAAGAGSRRSTPRGLVPPAPPEDAARRLARPAVLPRPTRAPRCSSRTSARPPPPRRDHAASSRRRRYLAPMEVQSEAFPVWLSTIARERGTSTTSRVGGFGTVVLYAHQGFRRLARPLRPRPLGPDRRRRRSANAGLGAPLPLAPAHRPALGRGPRRRVARRRLSTAIPDLVFALARLFPTSPRSPAALVWVKGTGNPADFANPALSPWTTWASISGSRIR